MDGRRWQRPLRLVPSRWCPIICVLNHDQWFEVNFAYLNPNETVNWLIKKEEY